MAYSQINPLSDNYKQNIILSDTPEGINFDNFSRVQNIIIGHFGTDTSTKDIEAILSVGYSNYVINPYNLDKISNSIAIGTFATIAKSNDFILGCYNRVAIGNYDPKYALHISNIFDIENQFLNSAAIYIDEAAHPEEFNVNPEGGGIFYIKYDMPKYKSDTLDGFIPIVPYGPGFISYIAGLWLSILSNVSGDAFASFTINDPNVTEDSYIFLTRQVLNVQPNPSTFGEIFLSAQTNGSFTVSSTNPNDTSQVQCLIVNFYNIG